MSETGRLLGSQSNANRLIKSVEQFNSGDTFTVDIEDFQLPEDQEKELQRKRDELIENQPEHEPNDGCDGGGCVI